jgi:hypothetical protein
MIIPLSADRQSTLVIALINSCHSFGAVETEMPSCPMEYTIEFGGAPQDVTITTSGSASAEGLIGYITDLVASPRWRAGMTILVDHRLLDGRPLCAADIKAFATAVVKRDEQIGPSRVAIVVPNPLMFGFARMYELHAERSRAQSKVFYSHSDALSWLEGGEATDQLDAAR